MNVTRPRCIGATLVAGLASVLSSAPARAGAAPSFEMDIRPLVERYCVECHNPDKLRGDLDLTRFERADMVLGSLALWQRIGMRVEKREMPPKKQPQPTDEERALIAAWAASLKLDNTDCNQIANEESASWYPGYVMSRRLNRHEYENTLRDLLGVQVKVAHLLPADGAGGEGFDNNGNALFLSSIQLEKYLEAADLAIESALPAKPRAFVSNTRSKTAEISPQPPQTGLQLAGVRQKLILAAPNWRQDARDAARAVLRRFAEDAWRRPVTDEEVERLLEVFTRAYDRGDGYETALKLAFKAVLVSPHFLFLAEPEPEQRGVYELGDFPLASRLSYFLWASKPDDELMELARQGALRDSAELQYQVQRMVLDPKARALGEIFAAQWLGITQLGQTTRPDPERFPEFDDALAESMRREAALVFNRIIAEDRSLLELINANYTFADERLAQLYGLKGVTGPRMRLVELDDPNRGGVLGMAAVLTATSHPLRTSPVLRGKWVLEQVLGDRVPPPPPDAGQLPPDDVQSDGLTLRARLEAHRTRAECASCHERMDPLGFGLEHFDPIGRWRDTQAGQPVDSKGVLPSGESFDGPAELKKIILNRKDEFARHFARKMLGYALGRSLTQFDQCVIDDCVKAMRQNDYRPSALLAEIVLSYPFRHRYSGNTTQEAD